ncbi:hypothetical protein BDQ17DRAFT_1328578 [Cyathus striatus]|nr:hypothetical protein BDQ17DRAFT_1328578 [Cyathus striatus]
MDALLSKKKRKANKDDEDNMDSASEPIQLPKKKRKANEDNTDSIAEPILPPKKKKKVKKTTENYVYCNSKSFKNMSGKVLGDSAFSEFLKLFKQWERAQKTPKAEGIIEILSTSQEAFRKSLTICKLGDATEDKCNMLWSWFYDIIQNESSDESYLAHLYFEQLEITVGECQSTDRIHVHIPKTLLRHMYNDLSLDNFKNYNGKVTLWLQSHIQFDEKGPFNCFRMHEEETLCDGKIFKYDVWMSILVILIFNIDDSCLTAEPPKEWHFPLTLTPLSSLEGEHGESEVVSADEVESNNNTKLLEDEGESTNEATLPLEGEAEPLDDGEIKSADKAIVPLEDNAEPLQGDVETNEVKSVSDSPFDCRCGMKGNGSEIDDEGSPEVQCDFCRAWMHIACQRDGCASNLKANMDFKCDECLYPTALLQLNKYSYPQAQKPLNWEKNKLSNQLIPGCGALIHIRDHWYPSRIITKIGRYELWGNLKGQCAKCNSWYPYGNLPKGWSDPNFEDFEEDFERGPLYEKSELDSEVPVQMEEKPHPKPHPKRRTIQSLDIPHSDTP